MSQRQRATTIGATEAARRIEVDRVAVLDVRDQLEWEEGHIEGARHIYVGELEHRLPARARDYPIVVHCSVGNRSGIAASVLARHGFNKVYNLIGGMKAWRNQGLPLTESASQN